jgi:hypothetical protein
MKVRDFIELLQKPDLMNKAESTSILEQEVNFHTQVDRLVILSVYLTHDNGVCVDMDYAEDEDE